RDRHELAAPPRRAARRAPQPARSAGSGGGPSFDDLVRPPQRRRRDRQAKGLGGLEGEQELGRRRLLDRNLARAGSASGSGYDLGSRWHGSATIEPVGHEPPIPRHRGTVGYSREMALQR